MTKNLDVTSINGLTFFFTCMLLGNGLFNKPMLFLMFLFFLNANIKTLDNVLINIIKSWPILIIFGWATYSYTWSDYPSKTLNELEHQWLFLMTIFLTVTAVQKLDWQQSFYKTAKIIIVVNTFYSVIFLNRVITPIGVKGIYGHKNHLGSAMLISLCCLLINNDFKKNRNYIILGIILLVVSWSKTSIALMLFIMLFIKLSEKKNVINIPYWKTIAFSILLASSIIYYRSQITQFLLTILNEESLTGRGWIWSTVLSEFNTLKGVGLAAFWQTGDYAKITFTDLYYHNREWIGRLGGADSGYFDLIINLGFIGLALMFFVCGLSFLNILRSGINTTKQKYLLALLLIPFFHNFTESTILRSAQYVWFLFLFSIIGSLTLNTGSDISTSNKSEQNE